MHDVVIVGIPLLAILAGIFFGRQDTSALRGEIGTLRGELGTLRADMNRRFDVVESRFDSRFNSIEARIDGIHRDFREFYAEQARHDQRISSLEQGK